MYLSIDQLQAQCSCTATDYASISVAGWTVGQSGTITTCQYGGERATINNTVAGAVYRISTCGASYDTQLSIYTTGCTYIAYNDDNGPGCSGNTASVQFTSPGGNLYSVMNRYNCTTQSTCATVTIQLISLPLAACTYTVPSSGSNSITTNSGAICDHAGSADYSNSVNGYTVIYPSNTNSLVRLAFNQFTTESSYDFVTIFDGVGVGGTILYGPTSGSPSLPTVTSLSGPLTIRFTSDGSVVYAGFNATISNIACTPPAVPGFGNGTWNVLGYTGGNIDLSGTFSGYYTESSLSYNTLNRWGNDGSPSQASGWQGCWTPIDNHVVVAKRTNFSCRRYQLDIPNHDDDIRVYVNGTLVFQHVGCCDTHTNIWTGDLNPSSTIEVRHLEGGVGSNQALTLVDLGPSPTLGTVSNAGPINFCDAGGNFGTALTVSGQTGTVVWDWGSNNGTWNNNWIGGNTSGNCCFPKKTSNSDGNADRIRYRVTNSPCSEVTSGTILIVNKYNEAPSSLATSSNNFCPGAVSTITLTATFPTNINMNGTVRFYSGSCGGTLVGTVTPAATSSTAAVTISAPVSTTTYYARYEPGSGTGCTNTTCATSTVTVLPTPANDNCAAATALCRGYSQTAFSTVCATGTDITSCTTNDALDIWYSYNPPITGTHTISLCGSGFNTSLSIWTACGGTQLDCNDDNGPACSGTQSSISISLTAGTTYYIRIAGYNGATGTGTLTVSPPTTGLPFGSNTWNIHTFSGAAFNNYAGYAANSTSSEFNLGTFGMGATSNPSVLSGYIGCNPGNDNWSIQAMRQGFTCGVYNIIGRGHDDDVQVFVDYDGNGTFDFTSTNFPCCNQAGFVNQTLWSGTLTNASRVQINLQEGGGDAYVDIDFVNITPTVSAGTIGGIANNTTICSGGDPGNFNANSNASGGTVGTTNGGSFTYSWELDDPGGGSFVSVAATANYDPPTLTTTGNYVYRRRATDQCGNTQVTSTITIIVVADPVISTQPTTTQTLCVGGSTTLSVATTGGTGTNSYQWFSNTANSNSGGTNLGSGSGAQTATYTPPTASVGTLYYYCTINQSGSGCGSLTSNTGAIIIVADPVAQTITPSTANGSTLCVGGTVSATFSGGTGGTGTVTDVYEFSTNGGGAWSAYTPGSNITATTGMLGVNTIQIRTRRTATGNGCDASAYNTVSFSVNQLDYANLQSPNTASICQGGSVTIYGQVYEPGITPGAGAQGAGITAELGYSTTNTNPNTWTNWQTATFNSGGGGANNDEYQSNLGAALSPNTYYYAFRYSLNGCPYQYGGYSGSGGGFWDGSSNVSGVLTVVADPSITISGNANVCVGGSVTLTANVSGGSGTVTTYQWRRNGTNVGTNSATYTTDNGLAAGTYNYDVIVTQSASGCTNTATAVAANVVADPSITISGNANVCVGGSVTLTANVSGGSGTVTTG